MSPSRIIWCIAAVAHAASFPALMPMPARITQGAGSLAITSGFRVRTEGPADPRLEAAARRLEARIQRKTGFSAIPVEPAPVLVVRCRENGKTNPILGEDESYQLLVNEREARLAAGTTTGALRGLETFAQLVSPGPNGFQVPAVSIEDQPRFPWRGLMLDVSRHWMPLPVVKRNLDGMAAVKLNVLHWHLSDDQGFRVESRLHPQLQKAGSDGLFYTQAEVREVVAYAADRGIRVVPEFDIPGHTSSWLAAYPNLASMPGKYPIERKWGVFEPVLDPTREETYRFLDGLLGEMAALFPDPYFHIGGDEVEDKQWKESPDIQAFAREHHINGSRELQAYFNRRVQELLRKHGKTMVGWDEVLSPGLAAGTIVQSWRGQESLADAARKGYQGVLSFGYYLDYLRPASFHYAVDPLAGAAAELNSEQATRILGGEACMWAEYVSAETVDSRLWPRLAAIAERLWSPREVRDVDSMYDRLARVSRDLDWVGLRHRAPREAMLDRLTGGQRSEAVRTLADACEALGIEGRRTARRYTSLVDLNRFVDAVAPESELVRRLEHYAAAAPLSSVELRLRLRQWAENDKLMTPLAEGNPFLTELLPLSKNLAGAAAIGLEALDYLSRGKPAPREWVAAKRQALEALGKPAAEVSLAAVRPISILLNSVSSEHETTASPDAAGKQ